MFQRLQQKWKVNGLQVLLILCTFAIGGSLTGLVGKKLMNLLAIDQKALWVLIYIVLVTLIWPMAVLLISVFFGQFRFFKGYLSKMGKRLGIVGSRKPAVGSRQEAGVSPQLSAGSQQSAGSGEAGVKLAIFASGAGSNAQKIIDYFRESDRVNIALIVCNKPGAGVLEIAEKENIPTLLIEKEQFFRGNAYTDELKLYGIDFIILAGFLWKVPDALIVAYPNKIINIHPALLPHYGGKGMYGQFVHEAVIRAGEQESGITIHYVDGHYDNGDIIFQARCAVLRNDTPASLASRIHALEHEHYPRVIEKIVSSTR